MIKEWLCLRVSARLFVAVAVLFCVSHSFSVLLLAVVVCKVLSLFALVFALQISTENPKRETTKREKRAQKKGQWRLRIPGCRRWQQTDNELAQGVWSTTGPKIARRRRSRRQERRPRIPLISTISLVTLVVSLIPASRLTWC